MKSLLSASPNELMEQQTTVGIDEFISISAASI